MASFWLRAGELTLAVLALLVPLAFLLHSYDASSLKTTLLESGALVLAGCWLLKGLERGRWEVPVQALPVLLPAALLAVWALVRFAASPSPAAATPGLVKQLLGLSLFAVALLECGGARAAARFTSWLLGAGWVAGLYALAQAAGFDPLPWKGAFGGGVFATLGSPAAFGLFAAACAPLALARLVDPERDPVARGVDGALLAVLGAAVALTGSLEAVAAFLGAGAISAAVLPGFLPSRSSRRAALGAFALTAAVAFAAVLNASRPSVPTSDTSRRGLWTASAQMVREHPLTGVGPGRFALDLDERRGQPALADLAYDGRPEHAPGLLVETAAELGLPGAALWLWLFGAVAASCWRARRRFIARAALQESAQLAGLFGALLALLFASQWNASANEAAAGWLLWPLAGLACGLSLLAARGPIAVMPIGLADLGRRRLATASVLAVLALVVVPARWQAADVSLNAASAAARRGAYGEAARLAQEADVWGAPRQLESRYLAGSALLAAGNPAAALERLTNLEAEAPAFAKLQYLKGRAHLKLGNWELAESSFERQHALDPGFVPALEGLTVAAKEAGHYEAARRAALAAIALEPRDPVHYLALSDVYARERRLGEARDAKQQAARLRRGDAPSAPRSRRTDTRNGRG
jgi:O-antigen ligase